MNFNDFKFRAHSVGYLMGGLPKPLTKLQVETYKAYTDRKNGIGRPLTDKQLVDWGSLHSKKNAKPILNTTAKKFLERLVWGELTGRSSHIKAKYLDKGIQVEEKSLTLYSDHRDTLTVKNKERKTNELFTGECDIARYKVRDIKSSWSFETFPLQYKEIPNPLYEWQLDVYMNLFEYKRSELIYCLVDTPFKLIEDELRRLDWQFDILDGAGDIRPNAIDLVVETITNLIFTNKGLREFCHQSSAIKESWFIGNFKEIPEEIRIKIYKHNYSEERNNQLKTMVKIAREYMNDILMQIGGAALKINNLNKVA